MSIEDNDSLNTGKVLTCGIYSINSKFGFDQTIATSYLL